MPVVITHPERGIYVGHALGMAFWSVEEAADQTVAVTFVDEADARDHVLSWEGHDLPDDFGYVSVEVANRPGPPHATVDELTGAGLGHMLGELVITHVVPGHA